ncbi:MAG: hydroxymethylglutaryl-CoA synthase [Oligoflexia bacterium]|nr:hydroxymethylglutaryl-CoA synthase [Oligoflexia bacterium]
MKIRVGIEAIAFDVPHLYLDLAELAQARGVDPAKYTRGLGQRQMAVASSGDDTVALAVGAGRRLFEQFQIDRESVGLLIVGTETSVDQSKPVSSYVHEHLGLSPQCRSFETKHACYGAMAGLQAATDWVLSGRAAGRKALVIASDVARYGIKTAGEPTQGAGSVAMVISSEPRLLEFETGRQGFFSQQVMDFWRPTYSKDALVDGHYSMACYIKALLASYDMYAPGATEGASEPGFFQSFQACLYHAPFAKMAQKAHLALLAHVAGTELLPETPAYAAALEDYSRRVAPYLELQSRIGNTYTGSLFMALRSLLEDGVFQGSPAISLFSYGSGCAAEFMTARVCEGAAALLRRHPYRLQLDARTRVSVDEYEKLMEAAARMDQNGSFALGSPEASGAGARKVLFHGVKDHQRQYRPSH